MHDKVLVNEFEFNDEIEVSPAAKDQAEAKRRYNQFKEVLTAGYLVGIPQITIVRQWSAATDMYSVGVLLLYLLFVRPEATPSKDEYNRQNRDRVEKHFREMLETLEAESTFQTIWPALHAFHSPLRDQLSKAASLGYKSVADGISPAVPGRKTAKDFGGSASDLVTHLALNIPHFERIIHACERNSAATIMLLHFSLCCIQRQTALPTDAEGRSELFSKSRSDEPRKYGPASDAKVELRRLMPILHNLYAGHQLPIKDDRTLPPFVIGTGVDIKPYDANSEFINGPELDAYRAEEEDWKQRRAQIDKLDSLVRENEKLKGEQASLHADLKTVREREATVVELGAEVRDLLSKLGTSLSSAIDTSIRSSVTGISAKLDATEKGSAASEKLLRDSLSEVKSKQDEVAKLVIELKGAISQSGKDLQQTTQAAKHSADRAETTSKDAKTAAEKSAQSSSSAQKAIDDAATVLDNGLKNVRKAIDEAAKDAKHSADRAEATSKDAKTAAENSAQSSSSAQKAIDDAATVLDNGLENVRKAIDEKLTKKWFAG